jgi:hypothetical protein
MCLYIRKEGFVLLCVTFARKFESLLHNKTKSEVERRVSAAMLCNEYGEGEEWFDQLRESTEDMAVDDACSFISAEVCVCMYMCECLYVLCVLHLRIYSCCRQMLFFSCLKSGFEKDAAASNMFQVGLFR